MWAELVVEEGSVLYADETLRRATVSSGGRIAIEPGVAHHIEPSHDAVFHIQFYK